MAFLDRVDSWIVSLAFAGATGPDKAISNTQPQSQNCSGWLAAGKTLQDPFMSRRDKILAVVGDLQVQVGEIARRLEGLRAEVAELDEYELVGSTVSEAEFYAEKKDISSRPYSGTPPSGALAAPRPGEPSELERQEAAIATGQFFARCLSGRPRGNSGRSRIRLQNHIYVLVKTISGSEHTDPVQVFTSFSRLKPFVANAAGDFGNSIFAGFNAEWEARLAVREAGLSWPSASQ